MKVTKALDDQLMIMSAHRYCLGRQSYIVGVCIDFLLKHWHMMIPTNKCTILRDTINDIAANRAGADMDKRAWITFVRKVYPKMKKKHREYIHSQCQDKVAYMMITNP